MLLKIACFCYNRYGVEIAGGMGPSENRTWRIGLMGYNCTPHNVRLVLKALKEGIEEVRGKRGFVARL